MLEEKMRSPGLLSPFLQMLVKACVNSLYTYLKPRNNVFYVCIPLVNHDPNRLDELAVAKKPVVIFNVVMAHGLQLLMTAFANPAYDFRMVKILLIGLDGQMTGKKKGE